MIELVNITKVYNGVAALDNVSFEIEENEFSFLVGPSGSGKTTIIKMLIKEEEPSSGNLFFYDTDLTQIKGSQIDQLRREVGVVFQDFKLLDNKNLFENIAFILEVAGRARQDIDETVMYILDIIGLQERAEAFPNEISGGEKQKVAIGRAIAHNPKLLIADEPTGNLDPDSSWEIIELLKKINEWGTTVIMATHGSELVDKMGKRVIHLDKGKIVSDTKKGAYPQRVIQLPTLETVPQPEQAKSPKIQKEQKKEVAPEQTSLEQKLAADEITEENDSKKRIEEKEFEITFSTKTEIPKPLPIKPKKKNKQKYNKDKGTGTSKSNKKTKKHKRKGKDFVDLYKLKLPERIQTTLLAEEITTIKKLKKCSSTELKKIKGLGAKSVQTIQKALKKHT